jgi:glycosyltransferase involved in cell wall biosynthesis
MTSKINHKHEPVSEQEMDWISPLNTICETIRGIYSLTDNPEARLKCREATAMAKAMSRKLTQYKAGWREGFFDPNPNFAGMFLQERKPKKRVQIVTDRVFQWLHGYKKIFTQNGWEVTVTDKPSMDPEISVWLLMWLTKESKNFAETFPTLPKIQFIRRYDYYTTLVDSMKPDIVNYVVMLNDFLAERFKSRTGIEPIVIRNGVSLENWTYKERTHGKKIAMVGFLNMKKGFPLALQILYALPEEYTLHIAGGLQQGEVIDYLAYHAVGALKDRILWYKHVDNINGWLEDKNYLLSTAISEGCPNNVIEAMAKGIKPVVHSWPGAKEQFGDVFDTINEAIEMILPGSPYRPEVYRQLIAIKYGDQQFKQVFDLAAGIADV